MSRELISYDEIRNLDPDWMLSQYEEQRRRNDYMEQLMGRALIFELPTDSFIVKEESDGIRHPDDK